MTTDAKTPQGNTPTPRPWLREIHNARGDEARIAIVSRDPKFETGYYVVCADDMFIRREQAIIDYGFICEAVNSFDTLRTELAAARERIAELERSNERLLAERVGIKRVV